MTASGTVGLTVAQTPTAIAVTPQNAVLLPGESVQFAAEGRDQFGAALAASATVSWSVSGGGSISATGRFTAGPATGLGQYTVTAAGGGIAGTAVVLVWPQSGGEEGGGGGCALSANPAGPAGILGWALPYAALAALWLLGRTMRRGGYRRMPLSPFPGSNPEPRESAAVGEWPGPAPAAAAATGADR